MRSREVINSGLTISSIAEMWILNRYVIVFPSIIGASNYYGHRCEGYALSLGNLK